MSSRLLKQQLKSFEEYYKIDAAQGAEQVARKPKKTIAKKQKKLRKDSLLKKLRTLSLVINFTAIFIFLLRGAVPSRFYLALWN